MEDNAIYSWMLPNYISCLSFEKMTLCSILLLLYVYYNYTIQFQEMV